MESPKRMYFDKVGVKVVEAFKKRHFDAYYFPNREEAIEKIFELIPEGSSVSWGGSQTLNELNLKEKVYERGYEVIDREKARDEEERQSLMRKGLTCDVFLTSSNAITENGELFNIDGNGNRVASMIYGPKSVIVVCGLNKLVSDLDAAYSRVRHYVAPMNAQRFPNAKNPCSFTGECADCTLETCSCAYMVATRISRPKNKIKVILIGEELGM